MCCVSEESFVKKYYYFKKIVIFALYIELYEILLNYFVNCLF